MPAMPTTTPSPDPDLGTLVTQAREDLAKRISIPVDQIEVLEAVAVTWPDASHGWPQPGMRYKQVPTDGALIRLRAMGRVYEYHRGEGRGLFLCEGPRGATKAAPPASDLLPPAPASGQETGAGPPHGGSEHGRPAGGRMPDDDRPQD